MLEWSNETKEALTPWLINLGQAALLVVLVLLAYRVGSAALQSLQKRRRISGSLVFVARRVLRWITLIGVVLVTLHAMGFLEDAWTAITGILALVAIGFVAVWSVLSNTMCSIILILSRPFEVGDTIELAPEGIRGKVVNFTLLFTTLQADDGDLIQVPNNLFFQKIIRRDVGRQSIPLDEQLMREENTVV